MSDEKLDVDVYAIGLFCASVCTAESDDVTTRVLNERHPAGTRRGWTISEDATFRTGESNPCPCERQPTTHRHVLFDR